MLKASAAATAPRRRWRPAWPSAMLVLLALIAGAASPGEARVIGIVYDDSGSMARQINTAALAIQLLAATLDGRDGTDRLITLRLSEAERALGRNRLAEPVTDLLVQTIAGRLRDAGQLTPRAIAPAELQSTITALRDTFSTAEGGTPYIAVEIMLNAITAALGSGETGHLIVITDGVFDPAPPGYQRQFSAFDEVRSRLEAKTARITVDFLALGLQRPDNFFRDIDNQCVRPLLLSLFNGTTPVPPAGACADPAIRTSPGYHNLRSVAEIPPALEGIAAAISGTDRAIGARYVRREGAVVTIDSPLSITRIVSMAGGTEPQNPPAVTATSFTPTDRLAVTSEMARADTAAPGVRQTGVTSQFFFAGRPLPAGAHTLTYDRAVGDDVRFVFQTAARVVLRLRTGADPDSPEVPRDSAGRYRVVAGANYVFEAFIEDEREGRTDFRVPLDSLRGPVRFRVAIDAAGQARQFSPLTAGGDRATDEFRRAVPGELVARADAAIEGFLTLTSRPVRVVVAEDPKLALRVEAAERCTGCPPDTLTATFNDDTRPRAIGRLTLTTGGRAQVRGRFERTTLPDWITVLDPAGRPVPDGATLTATPGAPLVLELQRDGRSCAGLTGTETRYRLAFTPEADLPAPGPVAGLVRVQVTNNPKLQHIRTEGRTVEGTLTRSLFELPSAEGGLVFAASGFCAPPQPAEITTALPQAWVTGLTTTVDEATSTITATPRTSWWCACLAVLDWGSHTATASYTPPGSTTAVTATAPLAVAPQWWEGVMCLVVLLAIIWLTVALWVAWRAERFPRGAVIEVREGSQLPRHNDLRGRNWTLLKALLWPFRGFARDFWPHERYRTEDLEFTARGNGASIRVEPDMTDFEVNGNRAHEQLENNPKLSRMPVNFGQDIEIAGNPRVTLRLLRSMKDASST